MIRRHLSPARLARSGGVTEGALSPAETLFPFPNAGIVIAAGVASLLAASGLAAAALRIGELPAVALFEVLVVGALVAYGARLRRLQQPGRLAFFLLTACAAVLTANFFAWAASSIFYRADILIWSEGPFVQDILKLKAGEALYSAPSELSSFFYTPGAQVGTYLIAWVVGVSDSVAAFRLIQVFFVAVAAILATRTVWRISQLAGIRLPAHPALASALVTLVLFLAATNETTNPFTHLLHNDSLSVLVSVAAFACLVEHVARPRTRFIVLMALVPAVGFMVKQSLVAWLPLFWVYLVLFDRPRSLRTVAAFSALSVFSLGAVYAGSLAAWGADFQFWAVTAMSHHGVSPLRSFLHVAEAAPYFAAALGGGLAAGALRTQSVLLGPWLVSFGLLVLEAYTSGIAWMLNHMGPGSGTGRRLVRRGPAAPVAAGSPGVRGPVDRRRSRDSDRVPRLLQPGFHPPADAVGDSSTSGVRRGD